MTRILPRPAPARAVTRLIEAGTHPLLARIYAARGIQSRGQIKMIHRHDRRKAVR